MKKRIYLDHASSAPVDRESLRIFNEVAKKYLASSSAIHFEGELAREFLADCRKKVARVLRAKVNEIYFVCTSTEGTNIFIQGLCNVYLDKNKPIHILTSLAEHSAILEPIKFLEKKGAEVTYIVPQKNGVYDVTEIVNAVKENTVLVAISLVNSETGSVQKAREIKLAIQKKNQNTKVFLDASQAVNTLSLDVGTYLCDGMVFGGRKLGAVGGAVLFVKSGIEIRSIILGGGQEKGLRSGTESLPTIASLTHMLTLSQDKETREKRRRYLQILKYYAIKKLEKEGIEIYGDKVAKELFVDKKIFFWIKKVKEYFYRDSSPHILLLSTGNILGEEMLLRLDARGISVSTASACSILEGSGSHFLLSLGESEKAIRTVRISFDYNTTKKDIDKFVAEFKNIQNKYSGIYNKK